MQKRAPRFSCSPRNERTFAALAFTSRRFRTSRGVANVTHWNESRRSHLILRKDGFKQPFEFSSVAFISAVSDAQTIRS